jgi:hypothetical protein
MTDRGTGTVIPKSFDRQLTHAALSRLATVVPRGGAFSEHHGCRLHRTPKISFRLGAASDSEPVSAFNDSFFEDLGEVSRHGENDGLFVANRGERIIGCGCGID